MPVAYTNFDISNVYKGRNSVNKIMKGHNHVWPTAPVFSFDTPQIGGELNFKVSSDTEYVACTVNDADVYIFSTNSTNSDIKNTVRANGVNTRVSDTNRVVDISLPLFKRIQTAITGTGTSLARYGADLNKGFITITVFNPLDTVINFSISVSGKGTQTKSCPAFSKTAFTFSSLSTGTYTVTVNNLTDNVVENTTVYVNSNSTSIPVQSLTLKLLPSEKSASGFTNNVKIYSLTQEEAINNYTNAYGPKARISIDIRILGITGSTSSIYSYWAVQGFFKIISGGIGYPPNSVITVSIPNTLYFIDYGKSSFFTRVNLRFFKLFTDSNGTIVAIASRYYGSDTPDWEAPGGPNKEFIEAFGADQTVWSSALNENSNSMIFKEDVGYKIVTRDFRSQFSSKDLSNVIPHDYFYTAIVAQELFLWYASGLRGQTLASIYNSELSKINNFVVQGDGGQGIDLVTSIDTNVDIFGSQGTWFSNLLFDNNDSEGNIQAVELGTTDVSNIRSQSQRELKVIQSNYINTTTNKNGNSNVEIINTPNFEAMHGAGVTYEYINVP